MKTSATVLAPAGELPELARPLSAERLWAELWKAIRMAWQRILGSTRRPDRRLRLAETLGLGERRFVAVVEFDEARFLVGGTSASLVLLARLEDRRAQDLRADDQRAKDYRAVPAANAGADRETEDRL